MSGRVPSHGPDVILLGGAPAPRVLTLGTVEIDLHASGLTVTRFADGSEVPALAHDTADYLDRARAHGYGHDVAAMSRDHELAHTLIAHVLTGDPSPVLWRVAHAQPAEPEDDGAEEAAVMALQRLIRLRGISLEGVVARLDRAVAERARPLAAQEGRGSNGHPH